MAVHVAFLRGMNLGNRRISNADLIEAFAGIGFEDATAYRAAGNVIFEADQRTEGELIAEIEEGLAESLGYAVPTFIREAGEVRSIAVFDPFDLDLVAASAGKLQVSLLTRRPSEEEREAVLAFSTDRDRLVVAEREVYWLPSGGTLDSDLDGDAIAEIVGSSTQRTKGTIEGIASKIDAE